MVLTDREAVEAFQTFLRIQSESSEGAKGSYEECSVWLEEFAKRIGLPVKRYTLVEGKPIVVITWVGEDPSLPSVVLNSHYDVVPCFPEFWNTDPYAAVRTENGDIFARGTQDMKSVCVQYLLAVERLVAKLGKGGKMNRTLHLTYVPDEEIGGAHGMGAFASTEDFAALNPGIVLDEGIANPGKPFTVFFAERTPWWILVKAAGATGHGSRFVQGTAVPKLLAVANKAMEFRNEQEKELGYTGGCAHCNAKKLGDVTTLNLTMLKAGVTLDGGETYSLNVIPNKCEAGFDIRIPPNVPMDEIKAKLDSWCAEEGVEWEFAPWTQPLQEHHITSTTPEENFWWGIFEDTITSMGHSIEKEVFPAATDSRFVRQLKIPAIGFSPMNETPVLLHDHNEMLNEKVFLKGVQIYEKLISELANAPLHDQEAKPSATKRQFCSGTSNNMPAVAKAFDVKRQKK